ECGLALTYRRQTDSRKGSGTSGMLDHLKRKHMKAWQDVQNRSSSSATTKKKLGEIYHADEGAPRAQPSLRHLLRPRIETLQHGGRSGISLLHRRIFTIVRVSDDPPGDGQQAPDRVIDGGQHCDHCKTARTTRLGHQAGLVWSVRRH
ncbi:unnamed protein product, partial [Ascophyllum nodosum]